MRDFLASRVTAARVPVLVLLVPGHLGVLLRAEIARVAHQEHVCVRADVRVAVGCLRESFVADVAGVEPE